MSLANKIMADSESKFEIISNTKSNSAGLRQDIRGDQEIDLIDLAYALLDKIHYIILCFLIGAVIFNAYSYFMIHPTYTSTAKMYIVSASNDSVVDLTDLNIGTSLTADYEQLILSYPVLEQVIDEMNLDLTYEQLLNMIVISNPENTRILNVTVTSISPEQARDIANKLIEISIKYLPETMSTNAPNIAQKAKLADRKAGPNYTKYTMMGALLGAVLYCAYLVVMYLMDDTIHTPEDMEKYFGVVPLTTIPDSELWNDEREKRKRKSLFGKGTQKK